MRLAAAMAKLRADLRGWLDALRGLPDNPLVKYRGRPARRKNNTLRLLLTLGAVIGFIWVAWFAGPRGLFINADAVTLWAGAVLLIVIVPWLLEATFSSARSMLGALAEDGSAVHGLDETVLVSALTEQECVIGLWWQAVRRFLIPLAWTAVLSTIVLGGVINQLALTVPVNYEYYGYSSASVVLAERVSSQFLWHSPLNALSMYVHGLLATGIFCFVFIALSRSRRAGLLPPIAAMLFVLWQVLICAYSFVQDPRYYRVSDVQVPYAALALLWGFVALYLARRWEWLRIALASGLLLVFFVGLSMALPGADYDFGPAAQTELLNNYWGLTSISVLDPYSLSAGGWLDRIEPWYYDQGNAYLRRTTQQRENLRNPLMTLLQLCLLIMCAEFARDAVKRRKWATSSDVYLGHSVPQPARAKVPA